jgi:hypothetical protein
MKSQALVAVLAVTGSAVAAPATPRGLETRDTEDTTIRRRTAVYLPTQEQPEARKARDTSLIEIDIRDDP